MTIASHVPLKARKATAKKPAKKTTEKLLPKSSPSGAALSSVGVRELRQSASQILDKVKAGLVIEITEHGVPVARLVPITKSLYEEFIEAGLIIPARNPHRTFTMPKGKISKGKQLSEILIEERRAARF